LTNTADIIRSSITMTDICNMYGYTPNHAGFIICPIHNEKTASLRVYSGQGGWHCFGCNTGGSVIDFVMHIFGINFRQAIERIDSDFNLHLTEHKASRAEIKRHNAERAEKERKRAEFERLYLEKLKQHREYIHTLKTQKPINEDGTPNAVFMHALKEQPHLEYWLDENRSFNRT